jgi:hypothetical protein
VDERDRVASSVMQGRPAVDSALGLVKQTLLS